MLKVFKNELKSYNEIRIFNMETGEFKSYHTSKSIGFPFGIPQETTAEAMGYKNIKECLKELKNRGFLGTEINYEDQMQSEKIGYINLGVERIKRAGRVNTSDFEDIINKLAKYGLSYCDAQNKIIACYEHSV